MVEMGEVGGVRSKTGRLGVVVGQVTIEDVGTEVRVQASCC